MRPAGGTRDGGPSTGRGHRDDKIVAPVRSARGGGLCLQYLLRSFKSKGIYGRHGMRLFLLSAALLALPASAVGSGLSTNQERELEALIDESCSQVQEARECRNMVREAAETTYSRCRAVADDLKDRWLYFDDFDVYKLGWSFGGIVNSSSCTISGAHANTGKVREVRVEIRSRSDSNRMQYEAVPDDFSPGCREFLLFNCQ